MKQANALITGIDGAVGAYLARLLDARGVQVLGVGGSAALMPLGIADSVTMIDAADVTAFVSDGGAATVFAIAGDDPALAEAVLAAAAAAAGTRLCHITDLASLAVPQVRAMVARVAAWRGQGRLATNALLGAHDSRLGAHDTLPARIIRAVARQEPLEITESGPVDWGWTPEYVDAVIRLAALETPADLIIGSGHTLTSAEIAHHALAYFKTPDSSLITIRPGDSAPPAPINVTALKTATGWSASTWGHDLVRALCEGAADRN